MEAKFKKSKNSNLVIVDPTNDDFGAVLNCAIRYCLGRQTYMPHLVINYITHLLDVIADKTLQCFERDIEEARHFGGYGDGKIDEPKRMRFLDDVRAEINKRKEAGTYHYRPD